MVVARITTQAFSTEFDVAVVEWRKAGLLAPSTMRLHKLATLEKNGVRRRLGRLQEADQGAFWKAFRRVYCEPPTDSASVSIPFSSGNHYLPMLGFCGMAAGVVCLIPFSSGNHYLLAREHGTDGRIMPTRTKWAE